MEWTSYVQILPYLSIKKRIEGKGFFGGGGGGERERERER